MFHFEKLCFKVLEKKTEQQNFNQEFLQRMLPRLDWTAIKSAAEIVGIAQDFPDEMNIASTLTVTELFEKLHLLLLEIEIVNGSLACPETGRLFPISNGIPNMLLNEDEV